MLFTLTKIWYDEEKSNHWVDAYLEYGTWFGKWS